MDFYNIAQKPGKNGVIDVYPDFKVCRSKDLMVKANSFYAIWNEHKQMWSRDEYDVQILVDEELFKYRDELSNKTTSMINVRSMASFDSNSWINYKKFIKHLSDSNKELDNKITFADEVLKKNDYVSRTLPYSLDKGPCEAWDELVGTLYEPEERKKIEWAIGSIFTGDSKTIQKFIVFYGEAGAGKSTIMNIILKLFEGYTTTFEAKELTTNGNQFSTEVFKNNPLVAIQQDGDLSRIEDNTKLNSIISHEDMVVNEKFKATYTSKIKAFLFMGTNKPVKITDAKSGIIRRLIDVRPSGEKIPTRRYFSLLNKIDFELGAIANRCIKVYNKLGKNYYQSYRPIDMMFKTDVFFNYVEEHYPLFKAEDGVTLKQAYDLYKIYCDESLLQHKLSRHLFREELKNYFGKFEETARVNGTRVRSYYSEFLTSKFVVENSVKEDPISLVLDEEESIFDTEFANCPAQYANEDEIPLNKWEKVKTKLCDIDTSKIHYVKVPLEHIVIDFDLKDESGNKNMQLNLEAASKWPSTYTEFSKGGNGIHLHYYYEGNPEQLKRIYSEGIEIKVFNGGSSLRRKLSKCNNTPIRKINGGLPLKGEKMINFDAVKSEKGLRNLIIRNLKKEIHPGTKPSVDFISTILEQAYESGMNYDVSDMRPDILSFAANSTNHSLKCIKVVKDMKFRSEEASISPEAYLKDKLVFYDIEVFPNLLLVSWKYEGSDSVVDMFNPTPHEIEELLQLKLVGFNCRRYDNHILYARLLGKNNEEIYKLSQKIINESTGLYLEAYKLSYTDVYDFCSKKQSLKKWEIELGLHHQELGLPWDKPVDEDKWLMVADYCHNDVISTEKTFEHNQEDFLARQVLAELTGLTVNDSTNKISTKFIFGDNKNPQEEFVYTDLSEMFPGYTFDNGKSIYKGEEVGEGGYVWAKPGAYINTGLLDALSMHPTSIVELNLFGDRYTARFKELLDARVAIKHGDMNSLKKLLGGTFYKYIKKNPSISLKVLAHAVKIVINSIYGLTVAKFDNPFKDPRNIDNIAAKRGALFMIDLRDYLLENDVELYHIKTDSVKISNINDDIIKMVCEFGLKYGYKFELEDVYDRLCLLNNAVYIARYGQGENTGKWTATGTQVKHPYVFKTLFSKEAVTYDDLIEVRSVKTSIHIDMNEDLPEGEHNYMFVGKVGAFIPIKEGCGGGILLRQKKDSDDMTSMGLDSVGKTKGYRWLESEVVKQMQKEDDIDYNYYNELCTELIESISQFTDWDWFTSQED